MINIGSLVDQQLHNLYYVLLGLGGITCMRNDTLIYAAAVDACMRLFIFIGKKQRRKAESEEK